MLFSSRLVAFTLFVGFASVAARLPAQELESLSVVARVLGKRDWNANGAAVDPCKEWRDTVTENGVECNCSITSGNDTCHVVRIILKEQNLNGSLPSELIGLPFLKTIDLTRNYLSGFIPREWGSMKSLTKIAIQGNRLTGSIPKELANIATLEELVLEANQFTGTIPAEFGDFLQMKKLQLTSNNLTGELPPSLAKLTTLEEFRISDNNFTGSIPNYIQNWRNITRLEIQASGLTGPIPSNLTSLTKLEDLRISDLNGGQSGFPNLSTSTSWEQVILRSCNIVGKIPNFIEDLKINKSLDLSFNKLTGPIPPGLSSRKGDIYLTGNSLNGTVPELMKSKGNFDLSYNNFTTSVSSDPSCAQEYPNLFANSKRISSGTFYCVRSSCKPNDFYSFHINCGSSQKVDAYEADNFGISNFYEGSNWGFSSTGQFWNIKAYGDRLFYSSPNLSISGPESKLYTNARLSPLSLTYFGFCLRNGNYTVKLHFAEIMFTNDTTYSSLGRRIFDIYIQGNRVKKDFNIVNAAGGVNKPIVVPYTAVVDDHTLDIRFYWAGKGTNSLPERSVYGPLISAISVVHNNYSPGNDISTGAIVGIVMAVLLAVVVVLGFLRWMGCLGGKHSLHNDLKGLDLQTGSFTLKNLELPQTISILLVRLVKVDLVLFIRVFY